jgi:hypothetical protein
MWNSAMLTTGLQYQSTSARMNYEWAPEHTAVAAARLQMLTQE